MDNEYYQNARKWYNTIYVNGASERVIYFVLLSISVLCLWYSFSVIEMIKKQKEKVNTYVIFVNKKNKNRTTKVSTLNSATNSSMGILDLLVRKYVINMESLTYGNGLNNDSSNIMQRKTTIIKNLSSNNVYNYYLKNINKAEDSDLSLLTLKRQKIVNINRIEYIYEDQNIITELYNFISSSRRPIGANVFFTTETTDGLSVKKAYKATMLFTFFEDPEKTAGKRINFLVNDYYKEAIS